MARPRTPKAKAAATGRDKRDPARFEGRNEPVVAESVGEPHEWLKDNAKTAWREISAEIPWLNYSHRGHLAIAAQIRGRMMASEDVGVQALNLLRQCYGQMGATPADASKAGAQPDEEKEDPAEKYFRGR
ncbi:MAG: hypothetical protein EOP12_01220 [Pseudomonas sp.]|nr:MAG: hypothetical protein EOP12_01220 [Pseudomonas sp.]